MSKKYPLTEALGVPVRQICDMSVSHHNPDRFDCVPAADLEAALAKAPVVRLYNNMGYWHTDAAKDEQLRQGKSEADYTHAARLVCVQLIVRDSEERRLLRAILESDNSTPEGHARYMDAYARARALLGDKGES